MVDIPTLTHFKFWCQKVLPLVYDDSLSYYEVLCKVVKYINGLIDTDRALISDIDELKAELTQVQTWIDNYDTSFAKKIIEEHLATMIMVGITDSGFIVYYIPDTWEEIKFNTTELDIKIDDVPYGHLVLSY